MAWYCKMTSMLQPAFPVPSSGATYVQVTSTGEWQEATRVASGGDANKYLATFDVLPAALGVELLWEGRPVSFVGARLDGGRVAQLAEIVDKLIGAPDPNDALAVLADDLGAVTGAQCGAVNAWNLVQPITLWDGATWQDPSVLLAGHDDLRRCAYPVALEVCHENAYYAVEVSDPDGVEHVLDEPRLLELAHLVRLAI